MDVAVVAQTHDGEADQGTHVEGEDGYKHGLHTLQVTVEQDGHEHNLPREGPHTGVRTRGITSWTRQIRLLITMFVHSD